ncbi:MAG: DUF790 family protein [Candidatus Nezhaarchaeales archaeon]
MLPSTLLRVKRRGSKILPNFASLTYENEFAASLLIDVYEEHVGKTVGELEDSLEDVEDQLEDMGYHPKFIRGLIELLNRLVEAEKPRTKIPPDIARKTVFAVSSERGFAITDNARIEILSEAARRLNASIEEVVEAFNASYEDSEVITKFNAPHPVDLLKQYNLSLLQTLVFKATSMSLIANMTGSEAKSLLRTVKRLGLMYTADKENGIVRLHIDGPASTLTLTRRYGTRMARIIPLILRLRTWRIRADIHHMKRHFSMELDERYSNLMPSKPPIEETFDSMVEEDFMLKFKALSSGWEIVREPEPLIAEGSIFIPDFALMKNGLKVYLEIMGFWTPDYIERKIKKLEAIKEPIIIAVSKDLACTKNVDQVLANLPKSKVVIFEGKLKLSDVVPILRELEKQKGMIILKEIEPLPRQIDERAIASYLSKIEEESLQNVLNTLKTFGIRDFQEAHKILRKHGLIIVWKGLDQSKAIVKRIY